MQEHGNRRQDERVILACDAAPHVTREIATDPLRLGPIVSDDRMTAQPLHTHLRTQHIVKQPKTVFEIEEGSLSGSFTVLFAALEQVSFDLFLASHRRQVGERYVIGALEVTAFGLELRSALIVDQTRYRVREGSLPRVFVYFRANGIAMHQPSRAELQDGIQSFCKCRHLFVRDGTEI